MKSFQTILLASVLVSFGHVAQAADDLQTWADFDDIVAFTPKASPDAQILQTAVKSDIRFLAGGAQFKFTPHLEQAPQNLASGSVIYRASALMTNKAGALFYRKFSIEVGGTPRKVVNVQALGDSALSEMHFQVSAGLVDRMVVLEDVDDDIKMVFPLGVGGLDDNVVGLGKRLLTPRFQGAFLNRATVQPARSNPTYYRHMPYMPITNAAGSVTPIAFHITILSDTDWAQKGQNYLLRGFESRACMRMRGKDLMQFFTIVEHSADAKIPVQVNYFASNIGDDQEPDASLGQVAAIHPYPLESDSYQTVTNMAGPGEKPRSGRDSVEHLLIMNQVKHAPDLSHLANFDVNDTTDMKVFDGLSIDITKQH